MKDIPEFLDTLYNWIEPKQKEFLLNYVDKETLLNLLLKSGIQLNDLQYCISNRSVAKNEFCSPNTPYIMHSPTITTWFDHLTKTTHEKTVYNYTVPVYNTQVQLMVLRHLGLFIDVYCYDTVSQESLYGNFNGINVNMGMTETFNKNFAAIQDMMSLSVKNSVDFQPRKEWRDQNNFPTITEKGQWDIIKKSDTWKQLKSYCNGKSNT